MYMYNDMTTVAVLHCNSTRYSSSLPIGTVQTAKKSCGYSKPAGPASQTESDAVSFWYSCAAAAGEAEQYNPG